VIQRLASVEAADDQRRLLERAAATCDVEELLSLLKEEALRYHTVDPKVSLRLAEALILGAGLSARPEHLPLGLMAKGDALRYLGHYPEALDLLEEAGATFLAQRDQVGWARTRIGWLIAAHSLGRAAEALPVVERARQVFVSHQEWLRAGAIDVNTAVVCQDLGMYDRALDLYRRAQQAYRAAGPAAEAHAARAKANEAIVLSVLGHFRAALDLHEDARQLFVRRGDTLAVLKQEQNIAYVYAGLGDHTQALRLLGEAYARAAQARLDANAASIALNMVECYLALNRHAEALELAVEAAERFERCGTPTGAAKAQFYSALASARLGRVDGALDLLNRAAQTFAAAGMTREQGLASLERATLHQADEQWEAALHEAEQAHHLFAERGLAVPQAQAELIRARACVALGRPDEAAALARSALAITEQREALWLAHEGYHLLGRLARIGGSPVEALAQYDTAIEYIERTQRRLATELRSDYLEDKLRIYHDAIECSLEVGEAQLAFSYLERAKSRALVDYLSAAPDVRLRAGGSDDQDLLEELARLREEHNWFYSRLHGADFAVHTPLAPREAEAALLQEAIRDRERQIARVLERLTLRHADIEALGGRPGTRHQALPRVDERTALVEYYFAEEHAAAFVVSRRGFTVVPLAIRPHGLRRLLSQWHLNLDSTAAALNSGRPPEALARNARGILHSLYQALLAPVEESLLGCERLIVVPYGAAHAVPFHALYDGARFVVERFEVAVSPSSGVLELCMARTPRSGHRTLVMAYSDGERLPNVLHEAETVAALMGGTRYVEQEASRTTLIAAAGDFDIVHVAAHGEARLDNPTFAHVKLADGLLTRADVFNLQLDGALVTLSACESGRSSVRGGDELIGLSRGFLYAGASTLVQSLWRVEDGSTARLMERFYRGLRDGLGKGAALRQAQLALLAEQTGPTEHPYFWAPFQLVGDSGGDGGAIHVERRETA
jgi:CHAT domain-containing protein